MHAHCKAFLSYLYMIVDIRDRTSKRSLVEILLTHSLWDVVLVDHSRIKIHVYKSCLIIIHDLSMTPGPE